MSNAQAFFDGCFAAGLIGISWEIRAVAAELKKMRKGDKS